MSSNTAHPFVVVSTRVSGTSIQWHRDVVVRYEGKPDKDFPNPSLDANEFKRLVKGLVTLGELFNDPGSKEPKLKMTLGAIAILEQEGSWTWEAPE